MEFFNAVVDLFQADGVGIPHGPAAIGRKAVAVEVDDVDIDRAQGVAFLENARAFVDQGVHATIDDFFLGNLALPNARLGRPFLNQPGDLRIWDGTAVFVVLVPARASFLAVTAHLAEVIACEGLPNPGLFRMPIFFADSPADIETREIADSERAHGHAKIVKRGIDSLDAGTLFQ